MDKRLQEKYNQEKLEYEATMSKQAADRARKGEQKGEKGAAAAARSIPAVLRPLPVRYSSTCPAQHSLTRDLLRLLAVAGKDRT